ncbi:MAG TPA: PKD domain-containing protein [Gemmatimonadaceae bacterium]|nr:PKD domain-containing protein [Gemmatimonadaceae bacterium]
MRATAALALILFAACGGDALTDPVSSGLSPTPPDLMLTGGAGTPIFPTVPAGESQPLGFAIGLNASAQVTGGVFGLAPNPGAPGNEPFRWTPGGELVRLAICCDNGFGADINSAGAIAGSSKGGPNASYRGFVAIGTSTSPLPLLPGLSIDAQENHSRALALNDAVDIVGYSPTASFGRHAVRWSAGGAITDLGTLGGSNSEAVDINNAGQIIGMSQIAGDAATHAFLWSSASGMIDLNISTGAAITEVVEINGAGQIVGTYTNPGGQSHAFRYTTGSGLLDLGTLGGTHSAPTGLNEKGDVAGRSTLADGSTHAFLWTAGDGMEDITALTGVPEVRRLNDNMQTLTVTAPPTGQDVPGTQIPRLVQLSVTQFNAPPTAIFTVSCNALTCTLDASNSLDDKPGVTYSWDLNKYPEGSATGQVVTVTYPHSGQRAPILTITDAQGLTSSSSQTFFVSDYPIAAFTYSCTGLTCSFDPSGSTNGSGPALNYFIWTFGDGSSTASTQPVTPSHTYAQPGTYDVKLEVWVDGVEHRAILTQQVTVTAPTENHAPVASFTSSCDGTICTLDASSSTDDGGIASYAWNLGKLPDGTATGVKVTTDYWHTSTRYVTLTVTDAAGLSSSITKTVDVGAPPVDAAPVAKFTWSCSGTVCSFDASTSSDDVGIVAYAWNLNKLPDGTASGVKVSTDYWHTSTRYVTLTVTDTEGQQSSVTQTVTVP